MGKQSVSRIRNHDWKRTIRAGMDMAVEQARRGDVLDERNVMWALLREAAEVSRLAYSAPPQMGYPRKSSIPEGPYEITQWQMISAYLRGEVDEMPTEDAIPPRPSSEQVSRSEAVLELWHIHALARKGDSSRMKKAIYLKASGVPDRKVRAVTGLTRQAIHAAKNEAMLDMWKVVKCL